jgi:putative SOS response-associated peptidase YedK
MCGRFTLRTPAAAVAKQFGLLEVPPFEPRFNVAPAQPAAVVRLAPGAPQGRRQWAWLRWGLLPPWAKDPALGNRLINARAETAAQKPAFRAALRQRRCLVVADGFYEWQHTASRKQPYFFQLRDQRPFGFAGLWERWQGPEGSAVETCALLTTEANDLVRPIHDRMPVIVAPADYPLWLDPAVEEPRQLSRLWTPYPAGEMTAYAVGTWINSPAHEDRRCIEPLS